MMCDRVMDTQPRVSIAQGGALVSGTHRVRIKRSAGLLWHQARLRSWLVHGWQYSNISEPGYVTLSPGGSCTAAPSILHRFPILLHPARIAHL